MSVFKIIVIIFVYLSVSFYSKCNSERITRVSGNNLLNFKLKRVADPKNIIQKFGYPAETHQVVTEDGYILILHRIPRGIKLPRSYRPPVLIMHGLASSSADFVNANPRISLGYILADMGYDVWIGNARGNSYSNRHIHINPNKNPRTFYNFSWHEIGTIDIPTKIDYILEKTKQPKLFYIGHSQGCTSFYVMTSLKPEYNDKIRLASLMGPQGLVMNVPDPFSRLISKYVDQFESISNILGVYHLPMLDYFRSFLQNICQNDNYLGICNLVFSLGGGFSDDTQLDSRLLPFIFETTPSDASIKQFVHYFQEVKSGKFQQFDYGPRKNIKVYGSQHPPTYDISVITAPVALYYGQNDKYIGVQDVQNISSKLPNVANVYLVRYEKFNHGDFLFANDVKRLVYNELLRVMDQF